MNGPVANNVSLDGGKKGVDGFDTEEGGRLEERLTGPGKKEFWGENTNESY